MRDKRFVAVHRGGSLDLERHRMLALWAADCAEHVLPLFSRCCPDDDRPRHAIETARAWAAGEIRVGEARSAALAAHAAARETTDPAACAAARAAGQAVSVPHAADHSLGPAWYAVRAVQASLEKAAAVEAVARERDWQREHLPPPVRDLVLSALESPKFAGWNRA
ncbi:hypothetical protein JXA47_04990 [Candidatus Sumerlaeota bacterium]|nr:hypothetical protein [Candidatus Sumerlaeota bacterium]